METDTTEMDQSTLSPADLADIYSVIPFNVTQDDFFGLVSNSSVGSQNRKSASGMIIAVCITALYSVICVVGLLGNILVMYGVVR